MRKGIDLKRQKMTWLMKLTKNQHTEERIRLITNLRKRKWRYKEENQVGNTF